MHELRHIPAFLLLAATLAASAPAAANKSRAASKSEPTANATSRRLTLSEEDIARLHVKVGLTTLVVLPESERILDVTVGNREVWVVEAQLNLCHIKPAKEAARTNVNLITASGAVYSFLLEEVSAGSAQPDMKVFVAARGASEMSALEGDRKLVAAADLAACQRRIEEVAVGAAAAKQAAEERSQQAEDAFRSEYPLSLRFDYRFKVDADPFYVQAVYHDGRFTYIQADPEEAPALYELRDGQPNLIDFEQRQGVLVTGKVLDDAYLQIGKKRLAIERRR